MQRVPRKRKEKNEELDLAVLLSRIFRFESTTPFSTGGIMSLHGRDSHLFSVVFANFASSDFAFNNLPFPSSFHNTEIHNCTLEG